MGLLAQSGTLRQQGGWAGVVRHGKALGLPDGALRQQNIWAPPYSSYPPSLTRLLSHLAGGVPHNTQRHVSGPLRDSSLWEYAASGVSGHPTTRDTQHPPQPAAQVGASSPSAVTNAGQERAYCVLDAD